MCLSRDQLLAHLARSRIHLVNEALKAQAWMCQEVTVLAVQDLGKGRVVVNEYSILSCKILHDQLLLDRSCCCHAEYSI
jgi:hypothetical protein